MRRASERLDSAPVFPGQLPRGVAGRWAVYEPCGDGSEIVRNFAEEDLAMQCAVKLGGLAVEPYE